MSTIERASVAGRASAASRTPAERKASSHRAYLAGAVNSVTRRTADLTPEQIERLRAALTLVVGR